MACFHPVPAFRTESGSVVMVERGSIVGALQLPCGRCVGCRLERSRQWVVRMMHEASLYGENGFVTLTYDDAHLPPGGSLRYSDFQGFMRRLRERLRRRDGTRVKFYMCGEYGEELERPHYHVALFGCSFRADRYVFAKGGSGKVVYRSPLLESCWELGSSCVGELTPESAGYIARYVLKKVTGPRSSEHYDKVDVDTGEVTHRVPEFAHMSLRPGIGGRWFERFASDVFPHDRVVLSGRASKPPRYYDTLFKRADRAGFERVKDDRLVEAGLRWPDNTSARLSVKEEVTKARLSRFRRR